MKRVARLFFLAAFLGQMTVANHLQITGLQAVPGSDVLTFQVAWENAWRLSSGTPPANHDAVWVFFKAREDGIWQHLNVSTGDGVHSSGLRVQPAADGVGLFLSLADNAVGDVALTEVSIRLAEPLADGVAAVSAFGIETVYVPEGAFWVGDGDGERKTVNALQRGDAPLPFRIESEDAIEAGFEAAQLLPQVDTVSGVADDISAAFPKGFAAFYAMKYEITQQQYADFLNCLTYEQQVQRTSASPDSPAGTYAMDGRGFPIVNPTAPIRNNRNGLKVAAPGNASTNVSAIYGLDANDDGVFNQEADGQHRAMGQLSWEDLLAYLDWAGLRPMTELEYEKACRGPETPVLNELAWGNRHVANANTPQDDGTPDESVSDVITEGFGIGNHLGSAIAPNLPGPLRTGYAAKSNTNRLQAGASYYGLMEMSGNVWELCITVGTDNGLVFDGMHGDGAITEGGDANAPNWLFIIEDPDTQQPLLDNLCLRGGAFGSTVLEPDGINLEFKDLAVSSRFFDVFIDPARRITFGGRGVRKAP